ncbi:hypothetical protein J7438_03875 [Thalassotalea sp. G20_0]|uniref:hypothetical protein n=1 Tax=Thalassotalea sp. G20_0 TaxID=2821093 RepID=UPI001AD9B7A8|nr:hypothetical protein [Thalassotalea sp. G20_0]MBO9493230.1 hypothetical protein [Thalassotalea sp. G20_0]
MRNTGVPSRTVLFWNVAPNDGVKKPNPTRKPDIGQTSGGLKVTLHPPSNYVLSGEYSAFSPLATKSEQTTATSQNESESDAECDQEIQAAFAGISISDHSNIDKHQRPGHEPEKLNERAILKAKTKLSCKKKNGPPKPVRLHSYPGTSGQQVISAATLPIAFVTTDATMFSPGNTNTEPSPKKLCNSAPPVNAAINWQESQDTLMAEQSDLFGFHSLPYDFAPGEEPLE